jgi:hypothetical protein
MKPQWSSSYRRELIRSHMSIAPQHPDQRGSLQGRSDEQHARIRSYAMAMWFALSLCRPWSPRVVVCLDEGVEVSLGVSRCRQIAAL